MKFYGMRIYDLSESLVASGFPMLKKKYTNEEFEYECANLKTLLETYGEQLFELLSLPKAVRDNMTPEFKKAVNHLKRGCSLGNAKASSGHDCWIKGVVISVNIEADQSFWLQWERYHFQDTISSMSTMHCLCKFEKIDEMFSEYVDKRVLDIVNEKIEIYNNNPTPENFHILIHNCPEGIELCRRVTTNYLQLKNMYNQRKNHKMYSWNKDFIELINALPFFEYFCLQK